MQNKKRMNKGRFYLFACWLLLTACNSGIFIEEFAPGMPAEVTVQCGEPTVIHFANDDWELRSGTRYDYDLVKFTIERTAPTELTILATECLYDEPYDFQLEVENAYVTKSINLRIEPGAKYEVDSVAYDWGNDYYEGDKIMPGGGANYVNQGSEPIVFGIYPYQNAKLIEQLSFSDTSLDYFPLVFGNPLPQIVLPELVDGELVLRDHSMTLLPSTFTRSLDDGTIVNIKVEAGETLPVEVWLECEEYRVPFTVYASNPQSGSKRTFNGEYRYRRPYDYLIIPQNAIVP